jgi:opacity protein-like surface antigen
MKNNLCLVTLGLLVFTSAAMAADPDASAVKLSGTYVLIEHYKDVRAAERIAFQPDNRCTLDIDGTTGIAAKYDARADNTIAITPAGGGGELDYQFVQGKVTLKLSHEGQDDLYYGLLPDHPPAIQFSDVEGIVSCHNDGGDSVGEITADHHFSVRMRELSAPPEGGVFSVLSDIVTGQKRTYVDVTADGTCSYADGVIHYTVEHMKSPEPDQSLNDIVIKADSTGIWIIDATRDQVICQPRATSLELPPPPAGYTATNQ